MPTIALDEITRATTIAQLLYAAPAWWGFAHAKDRARVERFISKTMRMGYLPEEFPDAGELVDVTDRRLFAAVIPSSDRVLRPLFPPVISRRKFRTSRFIAASMNIAVQRKTIATLFIEFFFVL